VAHPGGRLDAEDLDEPGEDVGQRQEEERCGAVGLDDRGERLAGVLREVLEVAVCQ
jgi:hypothetical protein